VLLHRLPRPTLFPYTTLFRSERLQARRIDADAVTLHERQHFDERTLDVVVDRAQPALTELGRRVVPVARYPLRALREHPVEMIRSEEHTSELQSLRHLVCRLL